MAKKRARANGEGSIYSLPNGKWRVTVTASGPGGLRRISRTRTRRADCVALLPELRAKLGGGGFVSPGTVAEFFEQYFPIARSQTEPQTAREYERSIRKHVLPRIGQAKLAKLSPLHIEQFKAAMIADGVKTRAAQNAYQNLRSGLRYAVHPLRLIPASPCDGIKTPQHTKRTMQPFEAEQMRAILGNSKDTRWHAFYSLAFGTGMRAGELLGLRWSDIDTRAAVAHVRLQAITRGGKARLAKPKTKSSVRTIHLPAQTLAALREHRAIQMTLGLAGCDLVFPTLTGKILCYANFHKDEWKIRLACCGIPLRGFHNTRHTFATLSLLAGVPVPVVSKALGHSNPAVTMSVYAHCLPSSEDAASRAMGQLLG